MHPNTPPFFPAEPEEVIMNCPQDCVGQKTCACTQMLNIKPGKVIQFTFYHMGRIDGYSCTYHPLHIHGHHFYVVSVKYPDYFQNGTFMRNNKDIDCRKKDHSFCNAVGWSNKSYYNGNIPNPNLINPVLKDTVVVPCGGYTTIRFFSDNIGYWVMHCHIENHHANGMQLIIKEADSSEQIKHLVKLNEINFCHKGYVETVERSIIPNNEPQGNYNVIIVLLAILIFLILVLAGALAIAIYYKIKEKVLMF